MKCGVLFKLKFIIIIKVTETVFESCVLSDHPLHVWGLPSVDNSVSIQGLIPGDYYYLCAVAGHCDAGMKIKVCGYIY